MKAFAKPTEKPKRRFLQASEITLTSGYAGITAALGGFAGLIGSVFSSEIKGSPLFLWLNGLPPSSLTAIFLITLALFALLFGTGFRGQMRAQDAQADTLRLAIGHAEESLASMPPKQVLLKFNDQYRMVQVAVGKCAGKNGPELVRRLEEAIYACLGAMLLLASQYRPAPTGTTYSATLMIFVARDAESTLPQAMRSKLRFVDPAMDVTTLDGWLKLEPYFGIKFEEEIPTKHPGAESSTASPKVPTSDQPVISTKIEVPEFLLPVPSTAYREATKGNSKASTILPGAPVAFCDEAGIEVLINTLHISEAMKELAVSDDVVAQVAKYFESDPEGVKVRSFVSLAFGLPNEDPSENRHPFGRRIGVVNIHSSGINLLTQGQVALYSPLTLPFRYLLADLWIRYAEVRKMA